MAKIARKTQAIFAGSAANNGQFGSAQVGTKVLSNDPAVLQALAAWAQGWTDAVIGSSKFPCLEEFQALNYINTYQLSYLFQEGIPEYDAGTNYFQHSIVKQSGTYQLYGSVTDNNLGNALSNPSYWTLLVDLSAVNSRGRLLAPATFYVNASTGNDSTGNGTSGAPWQTPQHAVNYIYANVDTGGFNVTINTTGAFTAPVVATGPVPGGGSISIVGAAGASITTTGNHCIAAVGGAVVGVAGTLALSTVTSGNCLYGTAAGQINMSGTGINFGACAGGHKVAGSRGVVNSNGTSYTISGGAAVHDQAFESGGVYTEGTTVTLTGTPPFSVAYAESYDGANASYSGGTTFTGSATGVRYNIYGNGVVDTQGQATSFLPGNSITSPASGGQYI